jgi:protein STE50
MYVFPHTFNPDVFLLICVKAADTGGSELPPSQTDIAKIISIIKERDAEMRSLREDLSKISEENRKLREEVLPLVRVAKDRSHPLPLPDVDSYSNLNSAAISELKAVVGSGGLSRKFSNKRIFLAGAPGNGVGGGGVKNGGMSPTVQEVGGLEPSPAAMTASSRLQVGVGGGGGLNSPGSQIFGSTTSPTSPAYASAPGSAGPLARPFAPRSTAAGGSAAGGMNGDEFGMTSIPTPALSSSLNTPSTSNPPNAASTPGSSSSAPPIEIFKSFRVSIDDPCHKVLPVALKKYNISADWRQYALYIVHGDQERCLGLNEKPLILFKQLDKEGRKPMFMLRKHAAPAEGHVSVGGGPPVSVGSGVGSLPGGVL